MRSSALGLAVVAIVAGSVLGYAALRARGPSSPAAVGTPGPGGAGRPAPDFEITLYQGAAEVGISPVTLSAVRERTGRPIVLNFWAGLCPPCRAELPDSQRLYREIGSDRFTLLAVDIGPFIGLGSREDGKALLRELGITFPAGTTFDARTVRNYEIFGMPTTVFITADGVIWRKHVGLLTRGQMKALADELLRAGSRR